jgi:hypothetical protein
VLTARGLAHAPCTPAGICTDAHGDPWDLGPIGNAQIVDGPSDPTYTYKYAFSLYQNLDPVPPVCRGFSMFGTNSARYDDSRFGTCEQLGPDMNLAAPGAYQFSAKDEGLTFVYRYAGSQLTVNLECSFGAGKGTPSAVTGTAPNFSVVWKTSYACKDGAARGGSEGGGMQPATVELEESGLGEWMRIVAVSLVLCGGAVCLCWCYYREVSSGDREVYSQLSGGTTLTEDKSNSYTPERYYLVCAGILACGAYGEFLGDWRSVAFLPDPLFLLIPGALLALCYTGRLEVDEAGLTHTSWLCSTRKYSWNDLNIEFTRTAPRRIVTEADVLDCCCSELCCCGFTSGEPTLSADGVAVLITLAGGGGSGGGGQHVAMLKFGSHCQHGRTLEQIAARFNELKATAAAAAAAAAAATATAAAAEGKSSASKDPESGYAPPEIDR